MVHIGKMVISPGALKGKKAAQNKKWKLNLSSSISQEQYSIWSSFLVHMGEMVLSPVTLKGQKAVENKKWKLHPSCAMYQERYSIWS